MSQLIKHNGIVVSIEHTHVRVKIQQAAACATCAGKQLCHSSESKEKMIDVYTDDASRYTVGEQVAVQIRISQGLNAVAVAYGIPLLLLLATLTLVVTLTGNELTGTLASLAVLVAYYLIIYIRRDRITRKFSCTINHLN
ncbi:MAG: SoxR reducing system RseC family protein [Clostridium sp.]|nr:SoxR reducing system RseC family protein [Clostridium sp.]